MSRDAVGAAQGLNPGSHESNQGETVCLSHMSVTTRLISLGLSLLVIWTLNAQLVPGINESHYLTKAKHAWQPDFAPGDLFLASGNAHWLFAQLAGWMSTWLSLPAVAWVGRIASWILMAFAWQRCARSLRLSALAAACVLTGWILATRLGNWAGEWAIGGFEAKSLAYPMVVLALAELLEKRWARVWIWLGSSVAFHPLVGGWAGLTMLCAWLWFGRREAPLKTQLLPALLAAAISLIGIIPALIMIGGPARSGDIVAAQVHAFYRLAHHQAPHLFVMNQHIRGVISLSLLISVTLLLRQAAKVRPNSGHFIEAGNASHRLFSAGRLVALAWLSVGVSALGLIIDLVGVRFRPDIAASLLRFYWFRWSDVMVPLGWVGGCWCVALQWYERSTVRSTEISVRATDEHSSDRSFGIVAIGLLLLSTLCVAANRIAVHWNNEIAPADQTLLMSDSAQLASGTEVVRDWQAVCAWVHRHTPNDTLFLTPRAQQTFKWYAGRAEVVTFKDVPQDSQSLLQWYDRIGRCAPPRNAAGQPLGWTTAQLKRLAARYHFQYVIVDRRIQREPPLLEIVYPTNMLQNGTYAIFKVGGTGPH